MKDLKSIKLRKVSTNNLKALDLDIPLNKISVVTGVSGSGKSSLVFDTLYAESYRRYVESLSSFARQYIQTMPKPKAKQIDNLPAAIAVKQSRQGANNRSTVGTLTELTDFIQTLYYQSAELVCPSCSKNIISHTAYSVLAELSSKLSQGTPISILAPLKPYEKMKKEELITELEQQGFSRYWKAEQGYGKLNSLKNEEVAEAWILVDRLKFNPIDSDRFIESTNLAFKAGQGEIKVVNDQALQIDFSQNLSCLECNLFFPSTSLSSFSFNHP